MLLWCIQREEIQSELSLQENLQMKKGDGIMDICVDIDFSKPLTEEQKEMLEALKKRPVVPDEDCPALTLEQLKQMKRASEFPHGNRRKQM